MFRLILFFLLFLGARANGQSVNELYNDAIKAYENANYSTAISLLNSAADKLRVVSPRIESLKGLCYYAQEDFVNAKIALNRYFKTVPTSQTGSENHGVLVVINSAIDEELDKEEKKFKEELAKRRMQAAVQVEDKLFSELSSRQDLKKTKNTERLYLLYQSSTNKDEYNETMKDNLAKQEYEKFQYNIKKDATNKSVATSRNINDVLKGLIGKGIDFHIFSDGPTANQGPFKVEKIEFKGKVIEYTIICNTGGQLTVKEKGTLQGFDLTKLKEYEVVSSGSSSDSHIFTFSQPLIWKSGNAKYSDGSSYGKSIVYDKAEAVFTLNVPKEMSAELKSSFENLITLVKDAKEIKY